MAEVGGQAVLGRQDASPTPWLTERHGYDPTYLSRLQRIWTPLELEIMIQSDYLIKSRVDSHTRLSPIL